MQLITVEPVGTRVTATLDGEVIAASDDVLALDETGHRRRYYFPRADVTAELAPSDKRTHCPFKGDAGYHSIGEHRDVAWFYAEPKERVAAIRDHVAFYDERVEIEVG
jgi:uncharacterized protein (DUF427 family)